VKEKVKQKDSVRVRYLIQRLTSVRCSVADVGDRSHDVTI